MHDTVCVPVSNCSIARSEMYYCAVVKAELPQYSVIPYFPKAMVVACVGRDSATKVRRTYVC